MLSIWGRRALGCSQELWGLVGSHQKVGHLKGISGELRSFLPEAWFLRMQAYALDLFCTYWDVLTYGPLSQFTQKHGSPSFFAASRKQ